MPAQKYTAIYKDLKEKIEEGLYAPQSILPSENILTARYGVSRNTIRRAIAQLADESYVQSIHGKGVVVIYRKAQANMFSFDVIESMKEAAARNIPSSPALQRELPGSASRQITATSMWRRRRRIRIRSWPFTSSWSGCARKMRSSRTARSASLAQTVTT